MKMSRRGFLKTLVHVTATYAVAGVSLHQYGKRVEPERVVVERTLIPIKNLRSSLEGFKIVQMSDIHIEPYTDIEVVREAVVLTNSLQPDAVLLTGDYVSDVAEAVFDLIPVLAGLNARCGVFAIMGNHELWTNPTLVRAGLEEAGLSVLVNEGVPLSVGQDALYIAGLDDCWSGQPDLNAALDKLPSGAPVVLMAHEPDFADTFCRDGRVSLQLSGHTHGGQIRLPGLGAIVLPTHGKKYDSGLYNVQGMWVYTNRGLGVMPLPYRINCPPELTEITLIGA